MVDQKWFIRYVMSNKRNFFERLKLHAVAQYQIRNTGRIYIFTANQDRLFKASEADVLHISVLRETG